MTARSAWWVGVALVLALVSASGLVVASEQAVSRAGTAEADEALRRWALSRAAAKPGQLLTRERLLQLPVVSQVQLAPDGRHLFWMERGAQGRHSLWLRPTGDAPPRRLLTDLGPARVQWTGDGSAIWLVDDEGLAVIDINAAAHRRLWRRDRAGRQQFWSIDAGTADYAVISEQTTGATDTAPATRYLRLDRQGRLQLLYSSARPVQQMLLAPDGRLRATTAHDGEDWQWQLRRAGAATPDAGTVSWQCPAVEPCQLLGADARGLLLQARGGADKLGLFHVADDGSSRRLHLDPTDTADLADVFLPPGGGAWLGAAYEREQRVWYGRTPDVQGQLDRLQALLPGEKLALSASADATIWLVNARRADRPDAHHYLFWPASGRLQSLFGPQHAGPAEVAETARAEAGGQTSRPASDAGSSVAGAGLSPLRALRYRAADGMWLHGWLALPAGKPTAELPLVAFLHGGPIGRSSNHFDSRVQMLVNRGVAVFLPNFRGSTGHGRAYTEAIAGDVGDGRVLGDILDGLDYLLAQGIGDPQRQGLVGHSFGGYAALLGASMRPQRFRLVFAAAPPTEYGWMKQWQAEHDSVVLNGGGAPLARQFRHYGFQYQDAGWRQRMRQQSPLQNLPALQARAAIWAGGTDPNVPLKSVAHYAGEAARLGKPLSLLIDPQAGHAPGDVASSETYLWLLDALCHRQFGTPVEPPSATLRKRLRQQLRQDAAGLLAEARGSGGE